MKYPIVQIETKDNIWLHGLFLEAENSKTVFLHTHGTASNFYEQYFIEAMTEKFIPRGISMLSVNNRGAGVYDAYQKTGAAVEKFEDCLIDIDTWIEFAIDHGYEKIILSGHSLGTEKVVYYMNNGNHVDKVDSVVLLAPADSFGSHRMLNGEINKRSTEIEALVKQSEDLITRGKGDEFLPKDAYGSLCGIMPKSAQSFMNFLGPNSKLQEALPFRGGKLAHYSKIKTHILVVIGDQEEYVAIPITEALTLMEQENKNTQTFQIKDCDHDFQGKEKELADIVIKFINK